MSYDASDEGVDKTVRICQRREGLKSTKKRHIIFEQPLKYPAER